MFWMTIGEVKVVTDEFFNPLIPLVSSGLRAVVDLKFCLAIDCWLWFSLHYFVGLGSMHETAEAVVCSAIFC
jgi:hypothetical protein